MNLLNMLVFLFLALVTTTLAVVPPHERRKIDGTGCKKPFYDVPDTTEHADDAIKASLYDQEIKAYQAALYNMTHANDGFVQGGKDGVYRSWGKDGKVIDYVRLNSRQNVHAFRLFGGMMHHSKRDAADILQRLAAVNGHDVPSHELYNPPEHIMPPEFRSSPAARLPGPGITPAPQADGLEARANGQTTTTTPTITTITMPIPPNWPDCIGHQCWSSEVCWRRAGWDCWGCLQLPETNMNKVCVHLDYPFGTGPSPYFGPIVVTGGWNLAMGSTKRDDEGGEGSEEAEDQVDVEEA